MRYLESLNYPLCILFLAFMLLVKQYNCQEKYWMKVTHVTDFTGKITFFGPSSWIFWQNISNCRVNEESFIKKHTHTHTHTCVPYLGCLNYPLCILFLVSMLFVKWNNCEVKYWIKDAKNYFCTSFGPSSRIFW